MRALVDEGPRSVSVKDVPDADFERPTDVLVRVTTTNICGSEFIVSHELSFDEAPEAYENSDDRLEGWTKALLESAA